LPENYSLQVSGLGVSFGARVILAQVDFALPARGITALLGPSGTGKSTLLRTLAGLNAANPRCRTWGAADYVQSRPDAPALPRLVQQNAQLMSASTLDALVDAVRGQKQRSGLELRAWCSEQLEKLGMQALIAALDSPVLGLPKGQQRAVAIVREALLEPALLLADEPTAALGNPEATLVMELLRRIGGERAVLMSTHNQRHAQHLAAHVLLLAGGRIIEAGAMQDFLRAPQTAAARQFIASGSCSVPSPGANPEELDEGMEPPPPLPAAALAAIAEFAPAAANTPPKIAPAPQASAPAAEKPPPPAARPQPPAATQAAPTARPVIVVAAPAPAPPPAVQAPRRNVRTEVLVDFEPLAPAPQAIPASRGPSGFHWLVPGRLAGTPYPGLVQSVDTDLQALARCGVTTLITTTEKDLAQEPLQRNGLRNLHLPIYDREPPTVAQLHMLLARMSVLLRRGEVLAVHCLAGLGRTGTILAAWLVREGLTDEEALRRVRLINAQYVQSARQEQALLDYETSLLVKMT